MLTSPLYASFMAHRRSCPGDSSRYLKERSQANSTTRPTTRLKWQDSQVPKLGLVACEFGIVTPVIAT
jgi:hypothetical protein